MKKIIGWALKDWKKNILTGDYFWIVPKKIFLERDDHVKVIAITEGKKITIEEVNDAVLKDMGFMKEEKKK